MSREVSDRVWLIFYPVGLVLSTIRLIVQGGSWLEILLSVAVTIALSIALPLFGLWGGADGKAFICLALMNPLTPALSGSLPHTINPLFPLVVFSNAYIASLASMLYPIERNLRTRRQRTLFEGFEHEGLARKIAALITGYQIPVDELESKRHIFLLESLHREGSATRRHFNFDLRIDQDNSRELAEIKRAAELGVVRGGIWVSPGLPFLVFLTLGLGISLLLGDLVWNSTSALMRAIMPLV